MVHFSVQGAHLHPRCMLVDLTPKYLTLLFSRYYLPGYFNKSKAVATFSEPNKIKERTIFPVEVNKCVRVQTQCTFYTPPPVLQVVSSTRIRSKHPGIHHAVVSIFNVSLDNRLDRFLAESKMVPGRQVVRSSGRQVEEEL